MIWLIRNIGIRLWLTTLLAIPACFFLLGVLAPIFRKMNPILLSLLIIIMIGILTGLIMDLAAKRMVLSLIKEGRAWEHSGIGQKARKCYEKSIRIYDTFLLWPWFNKRIVRTMAGAVARFELNNAVGTPSFTRLTALYLTINPADQDVARLWLDKIAESKMISNVEQDILSRLAEVAYPDPDLPEAIARIFLSLGRHDFTARKIYSQVQKKEDISGSFQTRIDRMLKTPDLSKPIVNEVKDPGAGKPVQVTSSRKNQLMKFSRYVGTVAAIGLQRAKQSLIMTGDGIKCLLLSTVRLFVRGLTFLRSHGKVRFYFKWFAVSIILCGSLLFMINTITHLLRSRPVEMDTKQNEVRIPKPFTIQVAAYLKRPHADRYVTLLKKKGIDASIKEAIGGGKTWYVIHLSQFSDKKSAAEYGQRLVQQGIIEDYFVNNR